jgi:hypothetical protein
MSTVAELMEKINPYTREPYTRKEAQHAVNQEVFGADYKIKDGEPVEQGIGAPSRPDPTALEAYRKWGKISDTPEVYAAHLAKLEKQVADARARKLGRRTASA